MEKDVELLYSRTRALAWNLEAEADKLNKLCDRISEFGESVNENVKIEMLSKARTDTFELIEVLRQVK